MSHLGGWCSNKQCPCARPGRPCHNFEGFEKWRGRKYQGKFDRKESETWPFRYCIACSWERKDHKPMIHNGRKPR